MSVQNSGSTANPNGPVAAALLACGIGCFVLGVLAVAGDGSKRLASLLNFYTPTGPLAGVTAVAIAAWLIAWALLAERWRTKQIAFAKVSAAAFALLAAGAAADLPALRRPAAGPLRAVAGSRFLAVSSGPAVQRQRSSHREDHA